MLTSIRRLEFLTAVTLAIACVVFGLQLGIIAHLYRIQAQVTDLASQTMPKESTGSMFYVYPDERGVIVVPKDLP